MSAEHQHSHEDEERFVPSIGAFFANFHTYDAPFHVKLRMAFSNNLIKMRTRANCCGNHGQPGCCATGSCSIGPEHPH